MANMCLRMMCQLLLILSAFFSLVPARRNPNHQAPSSSTAPYDSAGLIQGSGYEGFSAEDLRDINGGNDDGNAGPITTSNPQNVLSSIQEATNDNDFQTPPTAFHDNQGSSIQAEEEEDVQRALWESLKVQAEQNTTSNTQTVLSSIPEATNDSDFQTPPQTPPTAFHDNQGSSIQAEEEEDVQRALWESLKVQDDDNAALELVKKQSLDDYLKTLKRTNGATRNEG